MTISQYDPRSRPPTTGEGKWLVGFIFRFHRNLWKNLAELETEEIRKWQKEKGWIPWQYMPVRKARIPQPEPEQYPFIRPHPMCSRVQTTIVLKEALRAGKEVIVSFPNFAHARARLQMCFRGRTPVTPSLPYEWHDLPNLHFLSISDFTDYCHKRSIKIEDAVFIGKDRRVRIFPNSLAEVGIFRLSNHPCPSGSLKCLEPRGLRFFLRLKYRV